MDSLGGILIKGLLGNPILAHFNLFLDITIEDITPTPTPTPSYEPTPTPSSSQGVTPTPTPAVSATLPTPTMLPAWVGGGGGTIRSDEKKTVRIVIRYKDKEYSSVHTITDKMLRLTINTISAFNVVKDKIINIALKFKKKETPTIQVKRHDD